MISFIFSWRLAAVAAFSHGSKLLFLHAVEGPIMQSLYENKLRKDSSALSAAVKRHMRSFVTDIKEYVKLLCVCVVSPYQLLLQDAVEFPNCSRGEQVA